MYAHCLIQIAEGLHTALDSLTTTDYQNGHKPTMTDFAVAPQGVEPHSYVAITDGHKNYNMAKVDA